ncbi:MAG: thermonuclease family protein [Pelagibacterales bacterium]|nr:thermonuclease family protein [Pelagibacterales bacterium]
MYKYKARLNRIIDGDTVDVAIDLGFDIWINERVRLAGIDAPEVRTKDKLEKAAGIEATAWLTTMFDKHEVFVLATTEFNRTGKYGRTIGTIYLDDINVNELMIKEGHAIPYP